MLTTRRTHIVKLVVFLAIGLCACGSSDKDNADGNLDVRFPDGTTPDASETSESTTFITLCDGYAAGVCHLDECFYPASSVSLDDCKKAVRDICEATITGPIGTHIDGDIFFDGSAAQACIDHFADAPCATIGDTTGDVPVACEEVFDGTLSEGAACTFDALCKPELFCNGTATGDTCSGTCTKRALLGQPCDSDTLLCARGLLCNSASGTCIAHHMQTGEACIYNEHCPATDYCDTSVHLCKTRIAQGASCTNFGCASGLTCLGDPKTCQPLPTHVGDACDFGCGAGLLCTSGTCAAQPEEGEPCIGDFGSCGDGYGKRLQCDPVSDTCIKWYQLGDACGGPNQGSACDGGYCDATFDTAGTCVPYKAPGDACDPFSSQCGHLGCTEAGTCSVDRDPCRGTTTLAPF